MRSLRPAFLALALVLSVASSPMATSLAMAICCPTTDEVCPLRRTCCASEAQATDGACAAHPARPARPASESDCPLLRTAPVEPARTRVSEQPAHDAHVLAVLAPSAGDADATWDALGADALARTRATPRVPSTPAYLSLRHLLL